MYLGYFFVHDKKVDTRGAREWRGWSMFLVALIGAVLLTGALPLSVRAAVSVDEVPLSVHRMAAQFLQDHLGTDIAPGWKSASLDKQVELFYRPDQQQVAYYEFSVSPRGYIMVSAGEHDFPIASWSDEGYAPSVILHEQAGGKASKYYKLDTLSYAAEDEGGKLLTPTTDLPLKIEGLSADSLQQWKDGKSEISEQLSYIKEESKDDESAAKLERTTEQSGPGQPDLKFSAWESWDQLKKEYASVFANFLSMWSTLAAGDWTVEKRVTEFGTGLIKGESDKIALLYDDPKVELEGDGAKYVEYSIARNEGGSSYVGLTVQDSPGGQNMADLTVQITYGNGVQESLRYFVTEGVGEAGALARPAWSAWEEAWAYGWNEQRLYQQWSCCGCVTGCGPVAWGILFGWADHQAAAGNSYWSSRWGIYRVDGGYGSNADAPRSHDSGVDNMVREIRGYVNTFCAFGSGATCPWDMGNASRYLNNRTGTRLSSQYNAVGYCEDRLRNRTRDEIKDHDTPVVIGTGWLSHYPVAYAYRHRSRRVRACAICFWDVTEHQRQFKINTGWGPNYDPRWVSAETWFCGRIFPN